jgi:sensor histidine kinase YesM
MRNQWYNTKWAAVSFHVLAWLLWMSLPVFFRHSDQGQKSQSVNWNNIFSAINIVSNLSWIVIFYLNANFLIPRFLNKKHAWQYVLILLAICFSVILLMNFTFQAFQNQKGGHTGFSFSHLPFFFIFPFLFIWAMSTVYRTVSDKAKTDQLLKEKENENLKTELSFLRSQVSPHFLFNVLNNMVALARLKSEKLEPSLIKLSGLMRYMLYESDEEKVPLSREVEYVTSFIDLQKLRFGKDMCINVNMDGQGEFHLIEPMLLIPFIENAFKHGSGLIAKPEIDISLEVNKGILDFRVRNKYNGESKEIKDKTSGIGLANVMRRLNLLYDKRHILSIDKKDGWFTASLQLKLQE